MNLMTPIDRGTVSLSSVSRNGSSRDDASAAKTPAFDYLARLARDPFAQVEHASDPVGAFARAGLSEGDVGREMAKAAESAAGSWASCQTCSDPGPDKHPDK